jgi:hypothetical protein
VEPLSAVFSFSALSKVLLIILVFFCHATAAHSFDVSFAWDANTEPDLAGYRVFARKTGQNYDFSSPDWQGVETTCTLHDLDDSAVYYFVARAYDIYGNESENSTELVSTDRGATVTAAGGGGGCFIDVAAFGSLLEPHVRLLRQFRDRLLLTNAPGKTFVRLYYTYSPPIAGVIAAHAGLRWIVRWSLLPLIGVSCMMLHLGVMPALLMLILLGFVLWKSYKTIRRRFSSSGLPRPFMVDNSP